MGLLKRMHPLAGITASLTILVFWSSTVFAELSGSLSWVTAVKLHIPWGLCLLVPALAMTGASGFRMAGRSTDAQITRKKRRMAVIAGNGLLVLVPSALYLAALAARGDFGVRFYVVQALELIAGATNLTLMTLNIRDGLRLTGRLARNDLRKVERQPGPAAPVRRETIPRLGP